MLRWPRRRRLRGLRKRVTEFVRALFGGGSSHGGSANEEGGVGVREPRRPLTPSLTGTAAVELPTDDRDTPG